MAYQKPKKDHPWKTGVMKDTIPRKVLEKKIKPVKILVKEISISWDTIEVYTFAYGREGKFFLTELPQSKQAAWLAGLLKKNYATF